MKKPKTKLSNKELMNAFASMAMQLEQLQGFLVSHDKLFTEYVEWKKDTEIFTKYLEEKYKDDKDNKKTKEK